MDGPCGIYGALDWPQEDYSRVTDFLLGVSMEGREKLTPLEKLIKAEAATLDTKKIVPTSVIILPVVQWRDQRVLEAPIYAKVSELRTFVSRLAGIGVTRISGSMPSAVTGLQHAGNWSDETRRNAVSFLERVPVTNSDPGKE